MRSTALCALLLLLAAPASAQYDYDYDRGDDRYGTAPNAGATEADRFSVRTGLGFTADPDDLLIGFEGDYAFNENFSAGVIIEVGIDDDRSIVSPQVYGRFRSDLSGADPELRALEPYIQFGIGFTHWDVDRRPPGTGTTDDTEFLMSPGIGVDYWVLRDVAIGSHMMINIIPDDMFGERSYFSWQVLTLRYRF